MSGLSRRALLCGCAGLVAAGGVAGLTDLARAAGGDRVDTTGPLRIGYLPITDAAPLLVAHGAGTVAPGTVAAAKPVLFRSWAALAEAFLSRQVDVVHLLMPMAVQLRYGLGADVRVLGWNHTNGSALTVAPHITEPEQLAGTQVAIPFWWSIHNILIQRYLRAHGLRPVIRRAASRADRSVELIVMSPSDMVPALANGSIAGLLQRVLCADDRRGIYTELTAPGRALYERARPLHDAALKRALDDAAAQPELAPVVAALHDLALPRATATPD
ncbi:ABC transporter substrate-binding protein [Nocardia farcinica]|nr:ABC transporter substrate-binding protein [Nocardia farcinica]